MSETTSSTQFQRRFKYGLLVLVMVVATLAIVGLINLIVYRTVPKVSWLRMDFTESGQYSLSEQTRKVIGDLDRDFRIVWLKPGEPELDHPVREQYGRVSDLLGEYGRRSGRVQVETIDIVARPDELTVFAKSFVQRYEDELKPTHAAIKKGKEFLEQYAKFAAQQGQALGSNITSLNLKGQVGAFINSLKRVQSGLDSELQDFFKYLKNTSTDVMPDYARVRGQMGAQVSQVQSILNQVVENCRLLLEFKAGEGGEPLDGPTREFILGLQKTYEPLLAEVGGVVNDLSAASSPKYDEVRQKIQDNRSGAIVMMVQGEDKEAPADATSAVVLTVDQVYRPTPPDPDNPDQKRREPTFIGEEVLTGSLLSLKSGVKPLVVILNPNTDPALGFGSQTGLTFNVVAEQLRRMNFEVEEWNPNGRPPDRFNPRGAPPTPRPQPAPGQKLVLVVLPSQANPGSQFPFAPPMPPSATAFINDQVNSSQPILFIAAPSTGPSFGEQDSDPVARTLQSLGLKVQSDQLIFVNMARGERMQAVPQLELTDFSADHPISRAVRGLNTIGYMAMPIQIDEKLPDGVQVWPLVKSSEGTWSEVSGAMQRAVKMDETDAKGPFVIAAAAQKGEFRSVVIGNRQFSTDMIAEYGYNGLPAALTGAMFPGNTEMFVNAIYWLAGMDELVAATARRQDIRRIDPIEPNSYSAVWWIVLLGIPATCLGSGVVVWFIRRR